MNVEQILNPEFLVELSNSIDRYYDSEEGHFNQGYEHFHNGAGQATLVVAAMEEFSLHVDIVGVDRLPEDGPHPEHGDGYDWAVVDNRWIVDLWLLSYYGRKERVLYDMNNAEDNAIVIQTFGPKEKWEKLPIDEKEIELARGIWNDHVLPLRAVDALLSGGLPER